MKMGWVCRTCGNIESMDNVYCTQCGSKRPEALWTCSNCGSSGLPVEWNYCIFCGRERRFSKEVEEWLDEAIIKVRNFIEELSSAH